MGGGGVKGKLKTICKHNIVENLSNVFFFVPGYAWGKFLF